MIRRQHPITITLPLYRVTDVEAMLLSGGYWPGRWAAPALWEAEQHGAGGIEHSVDLDKCIMICIYHYSIIQSIFTFISILKEYFLKIKIICLWKIVFVEGRECAQVRQ